MYRLPRKTNFLYKHIYVTNIKMTIYTRKSKY